MNPTSTVAPVCCAPAKTAAPSTLGLASSDRRDPTGPISHGLRHDRGWHPRWAESNRQRPGSSWACQMPLHRWDARGTPVGHPGHHAARLCRTRSARSASHRRRAVQESRPPRVPVGHGTDRLLQHSKAASEGPAGWLESDLPTAGTAPITTHCRCRHDVRRVWASPRLDWGVRAAATDGHGRRAGQREAWGRTEAQHDEERHALPDPTRLVIRRDPSWRAESPPRAANTPHNHGRHDSSP